MADAHDPSTQLVPRFETTVDAAVPPPYSSPWWSARREWTTGFGSCRAPCWKGEECAKSIRTRRGRPGLRRTCGNGRKRRRKCCSESRGGRTPADGYHHSRGARRRCSGSTVGRGNRPNSAMGSTSREAVLICLREYDRPLQRQITKRRRLGDFGYGVFLARHTNALCAVLFRHQDSRRNCRRRLQV